MSADLTYVEELILSSGWIAVLVVVGVAHYTLGACLYHGGRVARGLALRLATWYKSAP